MHLLSLQSNILFAAHLKTYNKIFKIHIFLSYVYQSLPLLSSLSFSFFNIFSFSFWQLKKREETVRETYRERKVKKDIEKKLFISFSDYTKQFLTDITQGKSDILH